MIRPGYLFISNSTKPNLSQLENRDNIKLNFFSSPCIEAAEKLGYELHMGINRSRPEELRAIGYDIKFYDSHTYRNIFGIRDIIKAYKNTCEYLKKIRILRLFIVIRRLVVLSEDCVALNLIVGLFIQRMDSIFSKVPLFL